jgi:DNA-binding NarL/FixJ family response regulator
MNRDLGPREREVVALVAEGKTNAQIALETGLSEATVKNYLANAMHKAGVDNRTALAVWWTSAGTGTNG